MQRKIVGTKLVMISVSRAIMMTKFLFLFEVYIKLFWYWWKTLREWSNVATSGLCVINYLRSDSVKLFLPLVQQRRVNVSGPLSHLSRCIFAPCSPGEDSYLSFVVRLKLFAPIQQGRILFFWREFENVVIYALFWCKILTQKFWQSKLFTPCSTGVGKSGHRRISQLPKLCN